MGDARDGALDLPPSPIERWGSVRPQTLEAVIGRIRLLTRPTR